MQCLKPRARFYCEDHGIIGKSYAVMAFTESEWLQVILHDIEQHDGTGDIKPFHESAPSWLSCWKD